MVGESFGVGRGFEIGVGGQRLTHVVDHRHSESCAAWCFGGHEEVRDESVEHDVLRHQIDHHGESTRVSSEQKADFFIGHHHRYDLARPDPSGVQIGHLEVCEQPGFEIRILHRGQQSRSGGDGGEHLHRESGVDRRAGDPQVDSCGSVADPRGLGDQIEATTDLGVDRGGVKLQREQRDDDN